MCGIVGYIGPSEAQNFLLEGLRRLEYRGYDSSGLAIVGRDGTLQVCKAAGRIDTLAGKLRKEHLKGSTGIGHTRWATHGQATDENAHPHFGGEGEVAVVHNGVIENYASLRERLIKAGYEFHSATDTEVIAHLIADCLSKQQAHSWDDQHPHGRFAPLVVAVEQTLAQLKGTYGLAVTFREYPDVLIAARLGSPLVVGIGVGEHFLASDASPLMGWTEKIVYLSEHQLALITPDHLKVIHRDKGDVQPHFQILEGEATSMDLGEFQHHMLKEIYEQPNSLRDALRGRLLEDEATAHFGGLNLTPQQLRQIDRIVFTGCGTSFHAGLVGEYLIEEFARIPVEVEYASELRYRNPPMSHNTLCFAITQSGETADTLAALREMKRKGHATLSICNVVDSTIAREADGGIYLHAGPEIGVASTKAFTSQCVVLATLALYLGRMHHLSFAEGLRLIESLRSLPDLVEEALACNDQVRQIAEKYYECDNFLYLGRQYNYPTALEGALKLKEISYIHAEGYPAAEMKHGPIALVDQRTPSVFVIPRGAVFDKVMSNLEEIKARGGPIIAVANEGDKRVAEVADDTLFIPKADEFLYPILASIPLQLLAFHIAVLRGCDVDKPRNLAKSVTVE
ncbi:Glutamine--fructose-6-phosphate aminotransferase [isomerizing] [Planctomycetales bacterium 10988]|nr:Glutamine--fructose-6-phosphate aminotransferase [isomerizing] [Planctomycetales bacterium 10988]